MKSAEKLKRINDFLEGPEPDFRIMGRDRVKVYLKEHGLDARKAHLRTRRELVRLAHERDAWKALADSYEKLSTCDRPGSGFDSALSRVEWAKDLLRRLSDEARR